MDAITGPAGHSTDQATQFSAAFDAWLHQDPQEVERWSAAGWDLHEAFVWQQAGFDPADADAWADVINSHQAPDPQPATDPGDWWTQASAVAKRAAGYVQERYLPRQYDAMMELASDPRDARDWLDAGLTVVEAGEWGCALTVATAEDATAWRSAGWNVVDACDREATLMHISGHEALFAAGGQGVLTDACAAWRGIGLVPRRVITCVRAGLSAEEAARTTWDADATAAVGTLADLLTPCLQK